jgi:nitroreductase
VRGDAEFDRVLGALDPANAAWAASASALVVGGFTRAGREGRPNPWAEHDLGMATAQLVLQAVASGLAAHPMAGFDGDRLRAALAIPAQVEPMTVTAIGWPAEESLPPRERVPLERVAIRGSWPAEPSEEDA